MERLIDIGPLKEIARRHLAALPLTMAMILEEADSVLAEDYFIKMKLWLQVMRNERMLAARSPMPH